MGKVIAGAGMNMSLDGFINDSSGNVGKLNPDFSSMRTSITYRVRIKP